MNLDELQSIQSRERQATSLQNLRATFYQDAGEFIQDLVRERDRAAERADDPFSSPEVRRLTDDIETAKATVEAVYERRIGKVVKTASIAAAGMPADDEGLTEEEEQLFESLVDQIEENREHVLGGILEGQGSDLSCARGEPTGDHTGPPDAAGASTEEGVSANTDPESAVPADEPAAEASPTPETGATAAAELGLEPTGDAADGTVSAADLMGDGSASAAGTDDRGPGPAGADTAEPAAEPPPADERGATTDADHDEGVERTTVRITRDIGEVFGVDERAYDLSADDVVTLPVENAGPLVERDAAERLN